LQHGYAASQGRARFWEPQTWGYKFFSETRRLWELEIERPANITTVQAAAVICTILAVDGMDKVGGNYLSQAVIMAKHMGIFDSLAHIQSARRRRVYGMTAWGLFGLQR
jgi:hypothetical protein